MEMSFQNQQKGDLEVMGVSRSGRVRKKSSKLMDFQSPDDLETKIKKTHIHHKGNKYVKMEPELDLGTDINNQQSMDDSSDAENDVNVNEDSFNEYDDDEEDDMDCNPHGQSSHNEDFILEPSPRTARRSIYMTEKTGKKKLMTVNGKVVIGKQFRKDKGQSRFTAYMLWAKEARQEMLFSNPDLDFSTISKKLGEMWANVPSAEKYNWKRRAKRFAAKGMGLSSVNSKVQGNSSKFINKGTPNHPPPTTFTPRILKKSPGRPPLHSTTSSASTHKLNANHSSLTNNKSLSPTGLAQQSQSSSSGLYKITGHEPADIAAYLKLLGDSLTIIGERLKEHEGQITVSGSLSVLLDSLLCSIGPLMCLTPHIPELRIDNDDDIKDNLSNILDNIAYVMPGL